MAGWILRSINGDFWTRCPEVDRVRENIMFNVTCENQRRADERIPILLELSNETVIR